MRLTILERLKNYHVKDTETGCWNWTAYKDRDGYGKLQVKRSPRSAHRLSYEHFIGPIPPDLCVRHKCDNPSCINPEHLEIGTLQDNMRDKKERQRIVGEKHPRAKLTLENILAITQSSLSQSKLAKMFGVTQAYISKIKKKQTWTHL